MSLKRKLVLVFDVVLVLAALQAGATVFVLAQVVERSAQMVSPALDRVDLLAHAEADILRLRTLELSRLSVDDPADRSRLTGEMDLLRAAVRRRLDQYAQMEVDERRASARSEVSDRYDTYLDDQRALDGLLVVKGREAAMAAYLNDQPAFERLDERIHGLRHLEYSATQALQEELVRIAERWRWVVVAVVVVVAPVDSGLGWYLACALGRSLRVLHADAALLAREELDAPIARPPEPELAVLADAMEGSRVALGASRAERARLEEERRRLARERLGAVVRAQEDERARIARELHDQAAQALTALRYRLGRIKQLSSDPAVGAEVDQLVELSAETGRQIARLARDLRPSVLDDLGLVPALRTCAREFSDRIGVEVDLSASGDIPRLSRDAETTIFRIVQEALTNVAKHARASRVWIELGADQRRLTVSVRDDGRGFEAPTAAAEPRDGGSGGLGLAGIRERAGLLEGSVEISSAPGQGTRLVATVPLDAANPVRKAA
jgi:signal transduction histidine kinase